LSYSKAESLCKVSVGIGFGVVLIGDCSSRQRFIAALVVLWILRSQLECLI